MSEVYAVNEVFNREDYSDGDINPESNKIKKAKFSTHNISGLLTNYDIDIE